jgi:aminoglycoside 6'-N-acetyltransferase
VDARPTLSGLGLVVRPARAGDVESLLRILAEPSVARWFGIPYTADDLHSKLAGAGGSVLLAIEVDGAVAGGIEVSEETDPEYRHAGIDLFLAERCQGRGVGPEAIRLVAEYLFDVRGHHRLTIDPAASNHRAIRAYEKVGFRPVGVMRQYELGADGRFHDGLLMDLLRDELADAPCV